LRSNSVGTCRLPPTGGLFQMRSLDVDRTAIVIFRAATEIRIATGLDTDDKAKMILDTTAWMLQPSDILIVVAGRDVDARSGADGCPAAAPIGETNVIQANIYAPRGTVRIESKTQATGAFIGDHVRIGQSVTLRLDSAFQ